MVVALSRLTGWSLAEVRGMTFTEAADWLEEAVMFEKKLRG